jgi:rare lipoprotein A
MPQLNLRARRRRMVAIGALVIGILAAVAAPVLSTVARAQTQPAMTVADPSLRHGQPAVVGGTVGADNAGRPVSLEHGSTGDWRVVATTSAGGDGAYAFRVRLAHSGQLRVALGDAAAVRAASGPGPGAPVARSSPQRVTVAAGLPVPARRLDVHSGQAATVRGVLRPAGAGRLVRLEALQGRRWVGLDSDRTDARGRYALAHRPREAGSRFVRVSFAGDAANAGAVRRIGRLHSYRPALASRYDLYGGALACGGSLGYHSLVVAHKTLPCGTKVRIRYRGRSVTATVRDRGPYVGGREYDLAGAVARLLGFDGVGTVWVTG